MSSFSGANIKGVGSVTVSSKATGTTTEPAPATFSNPLGMDSVLVGGFVGLNGAKSSIANSFSDDNNALQIQLTLDPTVTAPTLAPTGDDFTLIGTGAGSTMVTSTGNITGGTGYEIAGGFAGGNYGAITQSYSVGDVSVSGSTTQSNSFYTGGFAGVSSARSPTRSRRAMSPARRPSPGTVTRRAWSVAWWGR